MTLNDYFDKIVCINLAERSDKKQKMQERFEKYNVNPEWFESVKYDFIPNVVQSLVKDKKAYINEHQPFELGCTLSHYTVIKKALIEDVQTLLILEDDAMFRKNFNEQFEKYMNQAPNDWQVLMFYTYTQYLNLNSFINKKWFKTVKGWSTMAYAINKEAMKEYINKQNKILTMSDMPLFRMQEEGFNIYSAMPPLFFPDSEIGSNIRGDNLNYENNPSKLNIGYGRDKYE